MYIVIVDYPNGRTNYFGPFKTMKRAEEYGMSVKACYNNANIRMEALIVTPSWCMWMVPQGGYDVDD